MFIITISHDLFLYVAMLWYDTVTTTIIGNLLVKGNGKKRYCQKESFGMPPRSQNTKTNIPSPTLV